jgi:DNA polymerase-3 subunit delta
MAKNIIPNDLKDINLNIFYGKDVKIKDIMIRALNFPMLGDLQLIIVKEAQNKDFAKGFADFDKYFLQLQKQSIIVFCFKDTKTFDKRQKVYKLIEERGVIFESKKKYDNEVPIWIENQFKKLNLTIHPPTVRLLFEHVGNNLSQLNLEINKLTIALKEGQKYISEDDVAKNVGINRIFNVFELQKALGAKNRALCYRIIDYLGKNSKENPITVIVATLFAYFTKILKFKELKGTDDFIAKEIGVHKFFITEYKFAAANYQINKIILIFSYLRDADLQAKGAGDAINISDADILKELIFKILN